MFIKILNKKYKVHVLSCKILEFCKKQKIKTTN